jgi:hypothetical protein
MFQRVIKTVDSWDCGPNRRIGMAAVSEPQQWLPKTSVDTTLQCVILRRFGP